jgi:hypothetical protein
MHVMQLFNLQSSPKTSLFFGSLQVGNWHVLLGAVASYQLETKCSWNELGLDPWQDAWKSNSNHVQVLTGSYTKGKGAH